MNPENLVGQTVTVVGYKSADGTRHGPSPELLLRFEDGSSVVLTEAENACCGCGPNGFEIKEGPE